GVEVGDLHVDADDESEKDGGTEIGRHGDLPLIDQAAICFAGEKAQDIWYPTEQWAGSSDCDKFRRLTKCLSDKHRDALERAGCERANEPLLKYGTAVVIVAHRLVQQGYMTATTRRAPLLIVGTGRGRLAGSGGLIEGRAAVQNKHRGRASIP